VVAEHGQRRFAVAGQAHLTAEPLEEQPQRLPDVLLVIDHQNVQLLDGDVCHGGVKRERRIERAAHSTAPRRRPVAGAAS
jgi:hypothetical protein